MANNYCLFSEMLTDLTKEEYEWIKKELEGPELLDEQELEAWRKAHPWVIDDSDFPGFCRQFECRLDNSTHFQRLWIYAEEYGNPLMVAQFVQSFLKKFRPESYWTITWSETCSKPRVGEFGGGGVFVTAKRIRDMSGHYFVERELSFWKRAEECRKSRLRSKGHGKKKSGK